MNFTEEVRSRSDFVNIKSLPHLGMSLEKEGTKSSKICVVDRFWCAMKSLHQIEHDSKPPTKAHPHTHSKDAEISAEHRTA